MKNLPESSDLSVLFRRSFLVSAEKSRFYEWFLDFGNMHKIFPHILSMEEVNPSQPMEPGKEFEETANNLFGKPEKVRVKVWALNPSQEIKVKATNPRRSYFFYFGFQEAENGRCRFSYEFLMPRSGMLKEFLTKIALNLIFGQRMRQTRHLIDKNFPPSLS